MNLTVNDKGRVILETDFLNQQWTSVPRALAINSNNVMGYYPSRINLEYVADYEDSFYLVKNRVWVTYMVDTELDDMFSDESKVSREWLQNGLVSQARLYNNHILDELRKVADFPNPDDLTLDTYQDAVYLLTTTIDEVLYDEKQAKEFNLPPKMDTDKVLEMLGSLYMLYQAKKRILKHEIKE